MGWQGKRILHLVEKFWAGMRKNWRRCFLFVLLAFLFILAGLCVWFWPKVASFLRNTGATALNAAGTQTIPLAGGTQAVKPISNLEIAYKLGLAFAALLGLGFTWWRALCLGKQTNVAEQSLITDRFIKATEQLGHENESVRIGALYSLWRIAVDSQNQSDKQAVLDMFCAFIRSPYIPKEGTAYGKLVDAEEWASGKVREDIQIALTLLMGPRDKLHLSKLYVVDLMEAFLLKAHLEGAHLVGAHLEGANLGGAKLDDAHLEKAYLRGTRLDGAHLRGTHLEGAHLRGTNLEGADLREAHLEGAEFNSVNLRGTLFSSRKQLKSAILEDVDCTDAFFQDEGEQKTQQDSSTTFSRKQLEFAILEDVDLTDSVFLDEEEQKMQQDSAPAPDAPPDPASAS